MAEVTPLFPPEGPHHSGMSGAEDDELALLIACGAAIEQIARRLGRDLEHVYRDLLTLRLELDEEIGCWSPPRPLGWGDAGPSRHDP